MEIKRRKRARNSMSITPLVDVVFLLLLFFALTLHFSPEEAISVELPTSSSAKQQSETEIILTVTPEGVIRLNGNVPSQSLETELASLRKIDEKQAVQVRADQEVEVGKLVAIIDAIRNAGFQYFDLMTQQVNRK
ncbi:ExbD/TolR family protein [Bilophila wadsworthia]|uniref:ExbD/TolR family protein n=2 Tax=Bilophila wadsworthia TaxID=35833 RepID=UPI0026751FAF|nr:biopolymer transporter ExbD [Bilophila wadsworthia]